MKTSNYFFLGFLIIAGVWLWFYPDCPPQTCLHKNVLRVGTNAEYPPFEFKENGKIVGIDIDMVKAVAEKLGKAVQLVDMNFDMLMPCLQFGALDVVAAGLTPTPERSQQALFTAPYLSGDPFLIVTLKDKPPIGNIYQLANKKVIVNQGFTTELYIKSIRGPIVQSLPTVTEAFIALEQGKAYAFITTGAIAGPFFKKYGSKPFKVTPIPGIRENYSLAISKKNPCLYKEIQQALVDLKKDGTLTKIMKKWEVIS